MGKLFSLDNPFWRSLNTVADMLILNLLYVACCLPVITVGAATSALYAVSMKLASKDEDIYVTRSFFRAFVSNFKQATLIWLIFLGIGAFLLYDLYLVNVLYNLQWLEVVLLIPAATTFCASAMSLFCKAGMKTHSEKPSATACCLPLPISCPGAC